jgi:hypothetical protein
MKISLHLIKDYAMTTYRVTVVQLYTFFNSEADLNEISVSRSSRSTSEEVDPLYQLARRLEMSLNLKSGFYLGLHESLRDIV